MRDEWLTPRKKECLWPPFKLMSKCNKCLTAGTLPDENWKVYAIKRIFYETDDLIKAREKCKKAESDSEILTAVEENGKRKRKRKVINYDSDDESNQESEKQIKLEYPVPPKKHVKDPLLIEPVTEATAPRSCTNECNVDSPLLAHKITSPVFFVQNFNIDSPLLSPHTLSNTEELDAPPLNDLFTLTRKVTQNSNLDKINATLDVIGKYLGDIKHEMKELKQTQDDILLKLSSTYAQASLPENISIPLKEIEDLNNIETCLNDEENKEMLENYLSYIGGNKTTTIVRRILGRVFTNPFATQCNWTGKNSKHKLKDLRLIVVILRAVRRNKVAEKASNAEITDVITSWFRFAKDRDGGREQRRGNRKQ